MLISTIFGLLSKLFFLTGKVDTKATFEKPLTQKEEREYFEKMKAGDKY